MKLYIKIMMAIIFLSGCHTLKNTRSEKHPNQSANVSNAPNMLLGKCSRTALLDKPYADWFVKNYNDYKVDSVTAILIKPLLKNKKISIFMGTWCGDSRREVPRMLKILDFCGLSEKQVQLIMVNSSNEAYKQSPQHEEAGKNIFRVPDLIIDKKYKEQGRIIESPVVSLENDMLKILNSSISYTPNYKAGQRLFSLLEKKSIDELRNNMDALTRELKPLAINGSELNSVGYVLQAANKPEASLLTFEVNAKLYPDDVSVYNSLSEAYFKIGDIQKAKVINARALALDAKNKSASELLGKLN